LSNTDTLFFYARSYCFCICKEQKQSKGDVIMSSSPTSAKYANTSQRRANTLAEQRQQFLNQQRIQDEEAKKKKSTIIIVTVIIIVVVVLILIGVLVWYFYFRPKSSTTTTGGSTGSASGTGGTTTIQLGGACNGSTNVCAAGLICSSNVCTKPPQGACTVNTDCPSYYVCSPSTKTCKGKAQGTCSQATDCLAPLYCTTSGTCQQATCGTVFDPTVCATEGGGICNGTICGGTDGQYCVKDSDCAYPYSCKTGTPYNTCGLETCTGTSTTNTCTNLPGGSDASNGQCAIQIDQSTGTCSFTPTTRCQFNDQCQPYGFSLTNSNNYQVCDMSGSDPSFQCKLVGNSICSSGGECLSGICTGLFCQCTSNADCVTGTTCDVSSGTCS
jgi:hypothetical protein